MFARSILLGLLVIGVAATGIVGCGGGKKIHDPYKDKSFVGVWLESEKANAEGGGTALGVQKLGKYRRLMTINEDGTFKLTQATKDGSPHEPDKAITGTWELVDGVVTFNVQSDTLNNEEWVPREVGKLTRTEGSEVYDYCFIYHGVGKTTNYKRVE